MSIHRLAICIIALLLLRGTALGALSVSDITDHYAGAVVTVTTYDKESRALSRGSGFFIGQDGEVATSCHLFTGASRASIRTREGKTGGISEIVGLDPKADLIIARTSLPHERPLRFGDSDRLSLGQEVAALGNSGGLDGAISLGTIEGFFPVSGIRVIQCNAPLSSGGSGGPLLDSEGKVVGISTAFLRSGVRFHFAMPVNRLKAMRPTRLDFSRLPGRTFRLEAVMEGERLTGLMLKDRRPRTSSPDTPGGRVYFKNGRSLLCEKAWMYGNTIFLVVRGKGFALGYDQNLIDMERSFILYL